MEGRQKEREERQKEMEKSLTRLHHAAENDHIGELHKVLADDPLLLKHMNKIPVAHTPLHEAAEKGNTLFATEMAIMQLSLARKLNPNGLSPMHVALQANHFKTVRALMTLDPELIRVKGSQGETALHYVAGNVGANELGLLAEFLCLCKSSIDDLTCLGETAVHVAVKKHNFEAFTVLLGWLKRSHLLDVLDMKDVDGNTVLHIATSTNQPKVIQLLKGHVKVNVKNFEDKTALDIFKEQNPCDEEVGLHCDVEVGKILHRAGAKTSKAKKTKVISLSDFLKEKPTFFERFSRYFGIRNESTRNMILMVATLIATATYQAALSPPGGYWQDDTSSASSSGGNSTNVGGALKPHKAGNMILSGWKLYRFMLLNGSAFLASIGTILATAIGLYPDTLIVYLSITILAATYFGCINSEFPSSQNHAGSVLSLLYMYAILLVLLLPIWFYLSYRKHISRVDAKKRWVAYIRG